MPPLLVDTCLAIWLVRDAPIAASASQAINETAASGAAVLVSPISAWEVGLLVSRGRLSLDVHPFEWFEHLLAVPGVRLAPMAPRTLVSSNFLPGNPPNDPADRIIAATARDVGATLVTRDRLLLSYGQQGHVRVLEC